MATKRYFNHYVFPRDQDVIFIGLDEYANYPENNTPLLAGHYLASEKEVDDFFDEVLTDLNRARKAAKKKIAAMNEARSEQRSSLRKT